MEPAQAECKVCRKVRRSTLTGLFGGGLIGGWNYVPGLRGLRARRIDCSSRASTRPRHAGQSLVEFGLIVPILFILIIGVADLGRIFAAGVVLEAAARNAAELAANDYLSRPPGPLDLPAPNPPDPTYYDALHLKVARAVCAEARGLPNTNWLSGDCPGMPLVLVCIHDSADPSCGAEAFGATVPPECSGFATPPTNTQSGSPARYVEVRVCYRFTSITNTTFMSFGTVHLERHRSFTIPCYFVRGTDECG
jgi:hypothetical protein